MRKKCHNWVPEEVHLRQKRESTATKKFWEWVGGIFCRFGMRTCKELVHSVSCARTEESTSLRRLCVEMNVESRLCTRGSNKIDRVSWHGMRTRAK